jgi:hypothetical protein
MISCAECSFILKHGSNVNAKDNMQQTALHWAAVRGSIAAADVLLENGARVEASDINGYRVLFNLYSTLLKCMCLIIVLMVIVIPSNFWEDFIVLCN